VLVLVLVLEKRRATVINASRDFSSIERAGLMPDAIAKSPFEHEHEDEHEHD